MAPRAPNKRALPQTSVDGEESDLKKPRRSNRISKANPKSESPPPRNAQLPTPVTQTVSDVSATTEPASSKERTSTPPLVPPKSQYLHPNILSSPLRDAQTQNQTQTQQWSQFIPPISLSYEVDDEEADGVWGYLIPLEGPGDTLVLKHRTSCVIPKYGVAKTIKNGEHDEKELEYEKDRLKGLSANGYLVGRHLECDYQLDIPTVSNRHCLIFPEIKSGSVTAVLEDLSVNGTFVNDAIVGRNKRRELEDGDEIAILDNARLLFRYPQKQHANGFKQQYVLHEKLGKGHFATVYLCVEKNTGQRFAVKKFEKRSGPGEKLRVEGLQQEIAVLMGVSHPSLLCLKNTFDETDGVYLVLELAPEGELFNWIVMKRKLSEAETRKVFVQLFEAVKYLHDRNIVHRDIKPENILLVDKNLTLKLADFGLAKIIGEESFTTTLCGTPSYVAPEILQNSNHRRYTRAVDIWSLGVVLYICLCGFPPFSDELYTPENPYTLAQQILQGRFDYPSPYWDSVGDPALDLIDRMLTVDPNARITIDGCLEHPWTTARQMGPGDSMDSTDGLAGALGNLDFSRRKPVRERTLLASLNDVRVAQIVGAADDEQGNPQPPVLVFEKQRALTADPPANGNGKAGPEGKGKEVTPAHKRAPEEFIHMGGQGDQALFGEEDGSTYVVPKKTKAKTAKATKVTKAKAEKAEA
ncbi:SMAD/FHA protein kinase [Trichodelitschia bisporula]|uniref:SMAD/FHA protein kinase n=1 Tax=Trichodelitschia bisporula TaxID=703511 RepID=A0A6G1I5U9_9PEZI|nr:SMAD/FHA protein kinase [Trichodelitschia bisporula]